MAVRRFLTLAAAAALVVSACTGNSPASSGQSSSVSPASSAVSVGTPVPTALPFAGQTLRVVNAQPGSFNDVQLSYWQQQLKDKYGLTVQYNETASPDTTLRAVVSGAADVAVALSPTGLIDLVQQTGTDVKMLAADADASDDVLVSKASITGVPDLAGKTLGFSSPGAESDLIPHLCLNANGFDYASLKKVQIGGTSARMAALLAGQIDASVAHQADAQAAIGKSNGSIKVLLDCGKSLGQYPQTGIVATGAWITANPGLAQAVVDAYVDANRWAASNKDAYIALAKTWVPDMAPEEMPAQYDILKNLDFWPVNGGIDEASLQTYLTNAAQVGILTGKIPTTDKWVDPTFVNDYLARNGSQ
jgi:ABC-type nitrate/sulfonate/bicarbonate transport system substrate-binding protein